MPKRDFSTFKILTPPHAHTYMELNTHRQGSTCYTLVLLSAVSYMVSPERLEVGMSVHELYAQEQCGGAGVHASLHKNKTQSMCIVL